MGWIAVSGGGTEWVHPDWTKGATSGLLPRGTLLVETGPGGTSRPELLLVINRRDPWPANLSLTLLPGQGLALAMSQGPEVFQCVLPFEVDRREDALRITFAWDSPARRGRIAVERTDGTVLAWQATDAPPPLTGGDVTALRDAGTGIRALSDEIEPLGPLPSLGAETAVETPQGPRRVADLRCGDTVFARGGEVVPVLAQVARRLPALGACRPVRLQAPYFGLTQDLVVAPGQRLVVSGVDVEYLFGCEAVLIPASALVGRRAALWDDTAPLVTWHQILLPGHEPMMAAGAGIESLYVGRLRRNRALLQHTMLADVPGGLLPEHGGTALKVLEPFEAVTLAQSRAA